jgi:signal transduction histidine kinase
MSLSSPPYRQVYLFIDAIINFTLGNARGFQKSFLESQNYHAAHPGLDNYGRNALEIANLAIEGHYEQALDSLTNSNSVDLSAISKYDMGILIYKKMDSYDKALELEQQKEDYKDSLNSDLLYSNMNELNAQLGVAQAQSKAVKVRETMLITVLVMSAIMIVLLVLWLMRNRRSKEELKQKNEQLNAALAMAEEGERMKTEFVRSVSHEIRTPLNAINGFNDVLNTPGLEIPEEERKDMLQRIYENTKAITNIVDEMLRVADKESNEYASRDDKLYCNNFFSALLYSYRDKVSSAIELNYTTRLMNRFQLETNEEGVRKIIDHLIQNAIKFTRKGQINLHCELSGDNTMLLVSLNDTGTGIKAEVRDKIFEGFYKADTFQQGIGLGLTVSKKIAKKLGGDLTLDDSYTGGARFVLSLPAV